MASLPARLSTEDTDERVAFRGQPGPAVPQCPYLQRMVAEGSERRAAAAGLRAGQVRPDQRELLADAGGLREVEGGQGEAGAVPVRRQPRQDHGSAGDRDRGYRPRVLRKAAEAV